MNDTQRTIQTEIDLHEAFDRVIQSKLDTIHGILDLLQHTDCHKAGSVAWAHTAQSHLSDLRSLLRDQSYPVGHLVDLLGSVDLLGTPL